MPSVDMGASPSRHVAPPYLEQAPPATRRSDKHCGYIGAKGAGKSTTIKMLCGIVVSTGGTAMTCGLRPVADRRRLTRQARR